jgi:hypothetical protein
MYSVEIDPASIKKLQALRRAGANATRQMVFSGDTAVTRMVAFVTTEAGKAWEARAPRLTGTLAAATREQVFNEQGWLTSIPRHQSRVWRLASRIWSGGSQPSAVG